MNIILLGAPGAGKGTQAHFITEKFNIPHISTSNLLLNQIKTNISLGCEIKKTMQTANLVTDEIVIPLVKKRIYNNDCKNGFILDGFPRTIKQANAIKNSNISIDYILELHVPNEIIIERITGRRIHNISGRIYHIKFNPPKISNIDDITGESLSIRSDDQKEIIQKRIDEYYKITTPLIHYYSQESILGYSKYYRINGNQKIFDIHQEIISILS